MCCHAHLHCATVKASECRHNKEEGEQKLTHGLKKYEILEVGNTRRTFYTDVNRKLILDLTKCDHKNVFRKSNTVILHISKRSVDVFKMFVYIKM